MEWEFGLEGIQALVGGGRIGHLCGFFFIYDIFFGGTIRYGSDTDLRYRIYSKSGGLDIQNPGNFEHDGSYLGLS